MNTAKSKDAVKISEIMGVPPTNSYLCNIMAEGFRFMPLGLVRLRTFLLST